FDTLVSKNLIYIIDTTPPPAPEILSVSIEEDNIVHILFDQHYLKNKSALFEIDRYYLAKTKLYTNTASDSEGSDDDSFSYKTPITQPVCYDMINEDFC